MTIARMYLAIAGGDMDGALRLLREFLSTVPYCDNTNLWGIERSGFFNGREKWAKGFENQRV